MQKLRNWVAEHDRVAVATHAVKAVVKVHQVNVDDDDAESEKIELSTHTITHRTK